MFRPPLSPYLLRAPIPSALPFFAKFFGNPATPPPLAAAAASAGPVKFAFSYGVAFAGKPRRRGEQIPRGLAGGGEKGSWRSAMLAWGKERDAGEDFFMLREGEESQVRALARGALGALPSGDADKSHTLLLQPSVVAVADGVGGWAESGVDPSAFSQALMFYAWKAAQTDAHRSPSELLQQAYDGTMKESEVRAGARARHQAARCCTDQACPHRLGDGLRLVARPDERPAQVGQVRCLALHLSLLIASLTRPSIASATLASQ